MTSSSLKISGRTRVGSLLSSILFFPILAAFIASSLANGDMVMVMSLVSLILHEHHVTLALISLSVTLHIVGMFAPSVPFGWFSDIVGRKWVIALGALILGTGAFLTPIFSSYTIITFAVFLVGLGWSAINVATTALISDLTPPDERGRMLGANDVTIGLAALSLPALGGFVIANFGLSTLGFLGFLVALPALFVALPLRERPTRNKQDLIDNPTAMPRVSMDS